MLSPSQQMAVSHTTGPCLTLAGPGSGKTTVLTQRVSHLITTEKVTPEQILVITFTKAAAMEMQERFEQQMGHACPVAFGTFHSIFYQMLRQEHRFASYRLMDAKSQRQIIKEAAYQCRIPIEDDDTQNLLEREISFIKNTMADPAAFSSDLLTSQQMGQFFAHYEARKEAYRLLDFDDLLLRTFHMFSQEPELLRKWQARFRFLLIDEVQDMNSIQFSVVRMLAQPENNLFVVGDDDQSIYGFRGSDPSLMLQFDRYYPNARQIRLEENYRSAAQIVCHANCLIAHNARRFQKNVQICNPQEGAVLCLSCEDESKEARQVAQLLLAKHREGIEWEQMAVLFRNHVQSRLLVEELQQKQVPFYCKGGKKNPYRHFVMEDVMAYLRLSSNVLHRRDLFRIMNRPNRYLQRASIQREWTTFAAWKRYYEKQPWMVERLEQLERDVDFLQTLPGVAALTYIRKKMGYDSFLREYATNEQQYLQWQKTWELLMELARGCVSPRQLLERWEQKRDEIDKLYASQTDDKQGVGLYTLHGCKGLEFELVVILDCNEGILPSKKVVSADALEEERRLFYVGMTRAKRKLYLCDVRYSDGQQLRPSRFLTEMQRASDDS